MNKYQAQLDSICRRPYVKPKPPLTGLAKNQAELEEANLMWSELREEK